MREAPNSVTFESHPGMRARLIELFSLSCAGQRSAGVLHEILCCLPLVELPAALGYDKVFRVTIVSFLDRFNFCLAGVKRSCIHFVTPDGRIIPFDTYNMLHRPGLPGAGGAGGVTGGQIAALIYASCCCCRAATS